MKHALLVAIVLTVASPHAPAQAPRDRNEAWKKLLERFDADADGKLSRAEFTRNAQLFRRLDRDGDGFVSAAEFLAAPGPGGKTKPPSKQPGEPGAEKKDKDAAAPVAITPEAAAFFESRIRPLLVRACFDCHSAQAPKLKGGLRVDSRDALLAGGVSGAAIEPGDADASLLVQAVRYTDSNLQMPPKKRLEPDEVHDLEHWIALGAPWPLRADGAGSDPAPAPEKHAIDFEKAREFWAFRAPERLAAPATKDKLWPWSDIDRFLLAAMEERGAAPAGDVERRAWLRRVSFDLTGLPPTPEELEAFDKERGEPSFAAAVDRLLDSPAFGERWGRHWLDVARYAESSGKDVNILYPQAWRYRDWVIAAFQADMPYDRFLREQIAGDLLPAASEDERAQHLIATGYLALGAKGHNTRDRRQFAYDLADEQIDALSQGMLGLTVSCARCHDHKFDPIPTADYYAMAGILLSSETHYGTYRALGNNNPSTLLSLPEAAHVPDGPLMARSTRTLLERAREQLGRQLESGGKNGAQDKQRERAVNEQRALLDELLARFDESGRPLAANRQAMGVSEGRVRDAAILERGELEKAGAVVPRGFLQVIGNLGLPAISAGSGRRELAEWIAAEGNPLTARVWANRVWLHLFGQGLVRTPDNFGASGQRPTNPALLDWLATELVRLDWSTKKLVREIVLSHAYRLAARDVPAGIAADPENTTLWRMPERRLEAEAIRDAMLCAAGTLERAAPVGSPVGTLEGATRREELLAPILEERPVRSVYLPILRDHLPDALEVFDEAEPAFVIGDRDETSVATQALYLMNDADVLATADAFAARVLALPGDDDARIGAAFALALGRKPDGAELESVRRFLREFPKLASRSEPEEPRRGQRRRPNAPARAGAKESDPRQTAWSAFVQTLFQCAEFRYQS